MRQCIAGSPNGKCVVQRRPFDSGEPVYVFKDDLLNFTPQTRGRMRPIPCYTVKGLRSYMMNTETQKDGTFQDPLRRPRTRGLQGEPSRQQVTIEEDYVLFFVYDDAAMATGMCDWAEMPPVDEAPGPSTSQGSSSSVTDQMQQMGVNDPIAGSPEDESAKKKKKKKKKKSGGPSSDPQEASSDSPDILGSAAQAGPSSLPEQIPGSPNINPVSGSPSASSDTGPRQKIVLSSADVEKMRKSFEAAKARRAAGKREDQRVALGSMKTDLSLKYFFLFCFCVFAISSFVVVQKYGSNSSETDVYIEFSH